VTLIQQGAESIL